MNGTTTAATAAPATTETAKPEENSAGKIEIAVCESIFEHVVSRGTKKTQGTSLFHVEVRFIPVKDGHSICFQGERTRDRAKAEAEKTYVESVFKSAILKKPKPVKERTHTKTRKRSGRR